MAVEGGYELWGKGMSAGPAGKAGRVGYLGPIRASTAPSPIRAPMTVATAGRR